MKTRETITLDARAQQRLIVLTHVLAGELDPAIAAQALELSERQVRRLAERLRTQGAAGLVHGNRGRVPANRTDEDLRSQVVEFAQGPLAAFPAPTTRWPRASLCDASRVAARPIFPNARRDHLGQGKGRRCGSRGGQDALERAPRA